MVVGGVGGIFGDWRGGFVWGEMDCDGDAGESVVRKI